MEKNNKYSIRKVAVGTGSIIIGAILFLHNPDVSRASEVEHRETNPTTQQNNSSDNPQDSTNNEVNDKDKTQSETTNDAQVQKPSQEEQSTKTASNQDAETKQDLTDKEDSSDMPDQSTKQDDESSTHEGGNQKSLSESEQPSNNSEQPSNDNEETSKDVNSDEEDKDVSKPNTEDTTSQDTKEQEKAHNEDSTGEKGQEEKAHDEDSTDEKDTHTKDEANDDDEIKEQETDDNKSQDAISNKKDDASEEKAVTKDNETSKNSSSNLKTDKNKALYSEKDSDFDREQRSDNLDSNNDNLKSNENVLTSRDEDNENTVQSTQDSESISESNTNSENNSAKNINPSEVDYKDLEDKSSKQDKTNNNLKTAKLMSTNVKEEDGTKEDNVAKALGGNDVNDKIKTSNVKFTDGTWKKGSLNQIGFDLQIPEDVKRNDYFSVKVPKELNPTSADRDNGILLGNDENSIYAKGIYNRENNAFDFKFTDNVEKYKNKTSHVDLMALINFKEATKTDNYNLNLQVGNQTFTENRKIEYTTDARNTMVYQDSSIEEKDGDHNPYNTTYTINGQSKSLNGSKVKITPYTGSSKSADTISKFDPKTTTVSVVKVNDKNTMNQSGSDKNVNGTDESSKHKITYNSDGSMTIDLGNITGPYLIKVNSQTERPFVPNTFVGSTVELSASNIATQSTQSKIGKAKASDSNSSGVIVDDTTPPTVAPINDQTKDLNTPIDPVVINASDNSGKPVKNDVYGLPEGVTFDSETNTISGTPAKPGTYNVTVLSSDHVYNETTTEFTIKVEDATPPAVDPINNQTKEVNTPINPITINASDNSDKPVKNTVSGLPEGVTFDSESNTISGTPTKVGTSKVTVTSKDESGNTTTTEFDIKVEDTTAPDVEDVDDQTKEVNTPIDDIKLNGTDNSKGKVTHEVSGLPEGVTFDSESNTISGTPTKVGTSTITVTSTDESGNTTTTEFDIKVEDTTAPDVEDVDNQTKEVNTPIDDIKLNGTDNSKGKVTHEVSGLPEGVTFDSETNTISGTPTKVGTSTITVTSRDESGNETTTNFDIKVEDTTGPDVEAVDDQTKEVNTPIDDIKLNGTDNSKGKVTHEVSGLPEGVTFDSESNTISGTPTKVGTSKVTVTSTDESGNKTETQFDIKVEDTTAPDVEGVDNQTKEVNTPIDDIKLNGTDNSKGKVTHEVSGLPEGVTFDSETNTISGTPTKVGNYPVTVTSRDEQGNETTTDFDIKVEDTTAPDVEAVDDQTKEVNTPIDDIKLNGTDNSKGKVTHEVSGLPEGVTFDSETNTISGTPTKVGTSTITVTSRDESGNETTTNFDIKVEDTTGPDVEAVDDQTKEVNTPIDDIKLNGTDNSKGKVTHEVSGLPEGVTFDSETNTISGTPTKVGNYPVTVTSRDEQGNETTTDFDIKVEDTTAPDVEGVDNQTKEVNTPIDDIKLNGTDNSKGKVTHEVSGLPEGVTFDSETNTISGTPTKVGNYPVTVTSRDEQGNETTTNFDIKVEDTTGPDVEAVDDQTKEVNTPIDDIKLNGTDNSKGKVTHEVSGLPEGVTFDSESNTISGTPTKVGNYPVTVTSRDEQGNETTTSFTITVEDTTKPTVDNISNQTKEVNTGIDPIEINATDNSGQPVKNTVSGLPEGVTFDPETNTISGTPTKVGNYPVTVTSRDEQGNETTTTFTITVKDTTAPNVNHIDNQTKEINTSIDPIEIHATDNSGEPVKNTVSGLPEGVTFDSETNTISGTPTKVGNYPVTVTSRDEQGNETTTTFTIIVQDTTKPTVDNISDQTKEVNTSIDPIEINATDNSGQPVKNTVSGLPEGVTFDPKTNTISGTPIKAGSYKIIVTSTDKAGNSIETSFVINVEDNATVSGNDGNDIPNPNNDDNNSSTSGSEDNRATSTADSNGNTTSNVNNSNNEQPTSNSNNVTSKAQHNDNNVGTFSDENRNGFERSSDNTMSNGKLITSNHDNRDDSKASTNSEVTSDTTQNKDETNNAPHKNTEKSLPDTGQNDKDLTLLGSLMALFGAVLLGRKKKKDNKNQ